MEANLGPQKIQKSKVLKIKIRSAQIVGEVFLCRRKASPPHLGPSRPIFCVGRKNQKNAKLVRSPDPQPRNVRLGKRYVTPVVFFRYTVGYCLLYGLTLFLALRLEAAIKFKNSKMSDLVDCKYCCFWATVSKNLANIVFFACFRPEMLEHHCKYCYFWATVSKNLVNIVIFARVRPKLLEKIIVNIAIAERLSPKTL